MHDTELDITLSRQFHSNKQVSRVEKKKKKLSTEYCSEIFQHNGQTICFVFRTKGQLTLSDLYVSKYILEFRIDIVSQRRLKYMLFNNSS